MNLQTSHLELCVKEIDDFIEKIQGFVEEKEDIVRAISTFHLT